MLTGYNEAFIIDTATKGRLVAEDPKSAEILKPILRGRDIRRYRAEWAGKWVISTFPSLSLDIDAYPAIKRHLLSFGKARLTQAGRRLPGGGRSRKKTPNAWYALQDTCAYHAEFERDKLVWIELVNTGRFAYDQTGTYCEATTFLMTGKNLKYLCALLNSKIIRWLLQQIAPTSGMGTLRWKKVYVENIPVPQISAAKQRSFVCLIDCILQAKAGNQSADTSEQEAEIDRLVYKLYDLADEEIELVEGMN